MMPERKFCDADVRADDNLLEDAIAYAENYGGDWPFMVAARELVTIKGTLPTTVARGVLNAMLADPEAHLSGRVRPVRRFGGRVTGLHVVRDPAPAPKRQSAFLELPVKIKYPVGVPRWRTALVRIHRVDTNRSFCHWERPWIGDHFTKRNYTVWEPELVIYWYCGKRPQGADLYPTIEAIHEDFPDLEVCKKCDENAPF